MFSQWTDRNNRRNLNKLNWIKLFMAAAVVVLTGPTQISSSGSTNSEFSISGWVVSEFRVKLCETGTKKTWKLFLNSDLSGQKQQTIVRYVVIYSARSFPFLFFLTVWSLKAKRNNLNWASKCLYLYIHQTLPSPWTISNPELKKHQNKQWKLASGLHDAPCWYTERCYISLRLCIQARQTAEKERRH